MNLKKKKLSHTFFADDICKVMKNMTQVVRVNL